MRTPFTLAARAATVALVVGAALVAGGSIADAQDQAPAGQAPPAPGYQPLAVDAQQAVPPTTVAPSPQSSPSATTAPYPQQTSPSATAAPYPQQTSPPATAAPYPQQSSPSAAAAPYPQQPSSPATTSPYPQQPLPPGPAAYPQQMGSPQQAAYDPNVAAAARPHPIRQLFAGTLSALLQTTTGGVVNALAQGVTGSITSWFDRKRQRASAYSSYPQTTTFPAPAIATDPYASTQAYGVNSATTPYSGATTSATTPYSAATTSAATPYPGTPSVGTAYPGTAAGVPSAAYATYSTQYYDPRTGQATASTTPIAATDGTQSSLYAGVAYEVHALLPNGTETPVNAATYEFHTGDRFVVHFRPSLPGLMQVYNINPLGQQTRIDSVNMAAGQLTTLGPYQFAATTGDESLRLVLTPCGSESLYAQTRDIVNVSGTGGAPAATGGTSLASCGAPTTRSVDRIQTRDIQKVAIDGTTSFALDPVSATELASGQLASREVNIYFHHRQ